MKYTRTVFASACGIVLLCLPAAAQQTRPASEFAAVLLNGQKVGYSEHLRLEADAQVTITETMDITLSRAQTRLRIQITQKTTETADGKPLGFRTVIDMGLMAQQSEGQIQGDKLKLKTTTAGNTQEREADWPKGALLPHGLQLLAKAKGLKKGTTYTEHVYDTAMLQANEVDVVVQGRQKVDLLGRVLELTRVDSVMKSASGEMSQAAYVDDEYNALKQVTPMMGMKLEIVSCSEKFARSQNADVDFFSKQFVHCPASLAELKAGQAVTYVLAPREGADLSVMAGDNQSVRKLPGGKLEVTVRLARAPAGARFPYQGTEEDLRAATRPARYLECDRKEVIDLAKKAIKGAEDAGEAAHKIEAFVRKYVSKKNLSVGYASAAEVVKGREGDCSEHAVLVAAMCRAVGIPAEVVMGVAYVERFAGSQDIFVPHAWAQANVAGKWIFLDAALPRMDAGRIALTSGNGDLDAFFDLVNTLGCFKIESAKIVAEEKR